MEQLTKLRCYQCRTKDCLFNQKINSDNCKKLASAGKFIEEFESKCCGGEMTKCEEIAELHRQIRKVFKETPTYPLKKVKSIINRITA